MSQGSNAAKFMKKVKDKIKYFKYLRYLGHSLYFLGFAGSVDFNVRLRLKKVIEFRIRSSKYDEASTNAINPEKITLADAYTLAKQKTSVLTEQLTGTHKKLKHRKEGKKTIHATDPVSKNQTQSHPDHLTRHMEKIQLDVNILNGHFDTT
ncbi:hypothetical protein [Pedobacter sp. JCM 36344]|uniref:hypothetical protein n=1 Tax=Pedobacter sp. JCM 36344 TaxID=3374280 RepID=UPI00397A846B